MTRTLKLWSPAANGGEPARTSVKEGIFGEVMKSKVLLNIPDISQHPTCAESEDLGLLGDVSMLLVPIADPAEPANILAVIQLVNRRDNTSAPIQFSKGDENVLKSFLKHAAVAIVNSRMHDKTFSALANVVTIAKAVPDIILFVDKDRTSLASNHPLEAIFKDHKMFRMDPPGTFQKDVIQFNRLSVELDVDLTQQWIEPCHVVRDSAQFAGGLLHSETCTGYELIPVPQSEKSSEKSMKGVLVVLKTKDKYGASVGRC